MDEPADHLKKIIREENRLMPPRDPALKMPQCLELPVLGTATWQLLESNKTAMIDEEQFKKDAEESQKAKGGKRRREYLSVMQSLYCPELDELVDKRIDVLDSFHLDSGEKALRWCQGKVIEVLREKTKPTVIVHWEPMPGCCRERELEQGD